MPERIDPKPFGLPARTVLERLEDDTIALVVNRKSRIIMADGTKIMEKINKIKHVQPQTNCALKTSAPVCSKTITFLKNEGVELLLA